MPYHRYFIAKSSRHLAYCLEIKGRRQATQRRYPRSFITRRIVVIEASSLSSCLILPQDLMRLVQDSETNRKIRFTSAYLRAGRLVARPFRVVREVGPLTIY